jgi:hypothetical protein
MYSLGITIILLQGRNSSTHADAGAAMHRPITVVVARRWPLELEGGI